MSQSLKFKVSKGATQPKKGTPGSAGYDLTILEDFKIGPGEQMLIPTGVQMAIPAGYVGLIKDRSSMAWKHMISVKAGVIDSDYRGEIKILLHNYGAKPYYGKAGDRAAQMIIVALHTGGVENYDLDKTSRGAGGFGSTGK